MKELILAILAGICTYALLVLTSIGLESLGTWLYGWGAGGGIFAVVSCIGTIPAALIGLYVYEKI